MSLLFAATVFALVLFGPGAAACAALSLHRTAPILLLPPLAAILTLAIVGIVLAPALWIGVSIYVVLGEVAIISGGLTAIAFRRGHALELEIANIPCPVRTWRERLLPADTDAVALRLTILLAVVVAAMGFSAGAEIWGDQLYHTARSIKLAELSPTFDNTYRFVDGGAAAPYFLPIWHEIYALTSAVTGVHPLTVQWVSPAVLAPLFMVTAAGVGSVVFRTITGGAVTGVAWLLIMVAGYGDDLRTFALSPLPGTVVLNLLLPIFVIAAILAISRVGLGWSMGVVAVSCTLLTFLLHANYLLYFLAFGLAFVIAAAVTGELRRCAGRLGKLVAAIVVFALPVVAISWSAFASLDKLGSGIDRDISNIELLDLSRVGKYFVPTGDGFVLRSSPLLSEPATIVGLLLFATMVLFRRNQLNCTMLGGAAMLMALAKSSVILPMVLRQGNFTVASRMGGALLIIAVLGLAYGLLAIGALLRNVEGLSRSLRIMGLSTLFVVLAWGYWNHSLPKAGGLGYIRDITISAVPLFAIVIFAAIIVLRFRRSTHAFEVNGSAIPMPLSTRTLISVVVLAVVVAAPGIIDASHQSLKLLANKPSSGADISVYVSRIDQAAGETLRAAPASTVVAAQPMDAYVILALAPVYVMADHKHWLEATDQNRPGERLADAERAFDPATATDDRYDLFVKHDVDFVFLNSRDALLIHEFDVAIDQFKRTARHRYGSLYRVL